jgi:hypothetical protein
LSTLIRSDARVDAAGARTFVLGARSDNGIVSILKKHHENDSA